MLSWNNTSYSNMHQISRHLWVQYPFRWSYLFHHLHAGETPGCPDLYLLIWHHRFSLRISCHRGELVTPCSSKLFMLVKLWGWHLFGVPFCSVCLFVFIFWRQTDTVYSTLMFSRLWNTVYTHVIFVFCGVSKMCMIFISYILLFNAIACSMLQLDALPGHWLSL